MANKKNCFSRSFQEDLKFPGVSKSVATLINIKNKGHITFQVHLYHQRGAQRVKTLKLELKCYQFKSY